MTTWRELEEQELTRATRQSPLRGKPLERRPRLGPTSVESYFASLNGPLPYMVRLRRIEELVRAHVEALEAAWAALAGEAPADLAGRWRELAAAWDFSVVNELIDRHNRWYPAESRLPMDPSTGDYRLVGGRPYTREPLDAAWILARFPATD